MHVNPACLHQGIVPGVGGDFRRHSIHNGDAGRVPGADVRIEGCRCIEPVSAKHGRHVRVRWPDTPWCAQRPAPWRPKGAWSVNGVQPRVSELQAAMFREDVRVAARARNAAAMNLRE